MNPDLLEVAKLQDQSTSKGPRPRMGFHLFSLVLRNAFLAFFGFHYYAALSPSLIALSKSDPSGP